MIKFNESFKSMLKSNGYCYQAPNSYYYDIRPSIIRGLVECTWNYYYEMYIDINGNIYLFNQEKYDEDRRKNGPNIILCMDHFDPYEPNYHWSKQNKKYKKQKHIYKQLRKIAKFICENFEWQ